MAAYLVAAKRAVRKAAQLSVRVQRELTASDKVTKSDASPVTIGDFGCQAIVSSVLAADIGSFRLMGEEDAETLRSSGETLLQHVLAAVQGTEAETGGSRVWTAEDVIGAVGAGTHDGSPEDGNYWVLDPIDGTKGFLRHGQYAVGLAYVRGGRVDLAAIACPNLPHPSWWDAQGKAQEGGPVGTLFTAVRGQGAYMEALGLPTAPLSAPTSTSTSCPACPRVAAAASDPMRISVNGETDASKAVLCESFETGHSNHGTSAKIASLLGLHLGEYTPSSSSSASASASASATSGSGVGAVGGTPRPPIRIDSMCKYGLLARGDGTLYLRFPSPGYIENVWDHAPGSLLLEEAGGTVTDVHGQPLDFSLGRGLAKNYGIIASNGKIHDAVLAAVKKALAE